MNIAKQITVYCGNLIFIGVSLVGAAGLFGWIEIDKGAAVTALLAPCLGVVATIFKAGHFFEDPESETKLRKKHSEEMERLKKAHKQEVEELQNELRKQTAFAEKERKTNAQLRAELRTRAPLGARPVEGSVAKPCYPPKPEHE